MWERIRERLQAWRQGAGGEPALPIDLLSDEAFVEELYRQLLGRDSDPEGKAAHLGFLRRGHSRAALAIDFVRSPEFIFRTVRDNIQDYVKLLPLTDDRPDRYRVERSRSGTESCRFFMTACEADYDWLEAKILANGYYERPGVWSFIIDEDKRTMAAMAATFAPRAVLDIGCANGAVLKCLKDTGIDGDGLEVSRMALDKAHPDVRDSIYLGDLLAVSLPRTYDLVLGLDVFEHLNPNRIRDYLAKVAALTDPGGHVFTNIPAFGPDPVFGEIFPLDYAVWDDDARSGRVFRALPVDAYGYPKNGHLINATTEWWVTAFGEQGFARDLEKETALHARYDEEIRVTPARRAFYVFRKSPSAGEDVTRLR